MLSMHELSLLEPMLSLSVLILAKYPVADIRPRSKPKSKLTSPDFNMLTLADFDNFCVDFDQFSSSFGPNP